MEAASGMVAKTIEQSSPELAMEAGRGMLADTSGDGDVCDLFSGESGMLFPR